MAKKRRTQTKTTASYGGQGLVPAPSIIITVPPDLNPVPGNPFRAVATVTGQMGAPTAKLVDGDGVQLNPGSTTQNVDEWTFTFGSAAAPVPAGYYLLTVSATNPPYTTKKTIPVLIHA